MFSVLLCLKQHGDSLWGLLSFCQDSLDSLVTPSHPHPLARHALYTLSWTHATRSACNYYSKHEHRETHCDFYFAVAGEYLSLTGARLDGAGMLACGLATHFVPSERLLMLEAALVNTDSGDPVIISSIISDLSEVPMLKEHSAYNSIFLTMCHMTACSLLSYVTIAWMKMVLMQTIRSRIQFMKISALILIFCASVVGGNVSLK